MSGVKNEFDEIEPVDEVDEGRWGLDGIDVVAEPIRYPRSPLVALFVAAILPAIGLFMLARWADEEADEYEATNPVGLFEAELQGSFADPSDPLDTDDQGTVETVATRLLDYRRTPAAVASEASARQLGGALEPILPFLSDQSCVAVSVDGLVVSTLNPDLPVIPASNQKLLVALAALDVLGPDHVFTTSVAIPPIEDGVVDGDIYVIGGGDPLLTADDYPIEDDQYPAFATTSYDELADAVVAAGVTRIRGSVIGDATRYDDEFFVDEWADGIAFVEAGPYDALMANDSRTLFSSNLQDDPAEGAAREFTRLLISRGVSVDGGWGSGVASNLVPVLGSVDSAPLSDVITEMLVNSDDNTAEMLVKEIGFVASGEGTRAAGLAAIESSLEGLGVNMDGVDLRDGSGLAATNQVTCTAMLQVLQLGADGPIADALPVAAESGTLVDEFVDSLMAGRLTAKTGTLGNPPLEVDPPGVKALSGYVPPEPGVNAGTIEFAIIANQELITDETIYRPLWAAFAERFATFPANNDTAALGPR